MAVEGLVTLSSAFTAVETLRRLRAAIEAAGMTLFADIDQAAAARAVALDMAPTDLVIFGNARAGTPLMNQTPTVGIDLPLKVLVWEDPDGQVWLAYNDPTWFAERHALSPQTAPAIAAMSRGLSQLAAAATR